MNVKQKLLGGASLLTLFAAFHAYAQSVPLNVSAVVPESCNITSGASLDINFGTVDPINGSGGGGDYLIPVILTYECSVGTAGTVDVGLGAGTGASLTERYMETAGGDQLGYRLEKTSNAVFGSGSTDGEAFSGNGYGNTLTTTIVGRLTTNQMQAAVPGNYSDTVTVTLTL